jgi:hypothetical protein
MENTPAADPFFCLLPGESVCKNQGSYTRKLVFQIQNDLSKINSEGIWGDLSPHIITHLLHKKRNFHSKNTSSQPAENHPQKKNTPNPADLKF